MSNNLTRLLFDTLTVLNDRGVLEPCLAVSWEAEPGNQRWRIKLRPDVNFADGSPLTTDVVATSLRAANPDWKVFPAGDSVTIETLRPKPNFPAELALSRNAIVKRGGALVGTGPFTVSEWQPGKYLALRATENYWGNRPFVDTIQISLGQNLREQMIRFDLGKLDLVEIAPEQAHRAEMENRRTSLTQPIELLALVFARDIQNPSDEVSRQALALSVDRATINNVLLQGAGAPTGSLLPAWMSGYSFLFPSAFDISQALQLRSQSRQNVNWTLGYDINDPLARTIADRIALNARDAGISIQVSSNIATDIRLARVRIDSLDCQLALSRVAQALGLPEPAVSGASAEDLFSAESSLLRSKRVVPLLHLRAAVGLSSSVKNWKESPDGSWHVSDVWMEADRP